MLFIKYEIIKNSNINITSYKKFFKSENVINKYLNLILLF